MKLLDQVTLAIPATVTDQVELVRAAVHRASGVRIIGMIHDSTLGPALAGVRIHPYINDDEAIREGGRLSEAMSMKAAAADLRLGGATVIVVADPALAKSRQLLEAVGEFVATFPARLVVVNDVGSTSADMRVLREQGASVCLRDPSPFTALGVLEAMRAARVATGQGASLAGVRVAIQGVGNVGSHLAAILTAESAVVTVADRDPGRAAAVARLHGATVLHPDELLSSECDILAPCAIGSVVTAGTLDSFKCSAIVGGANNIIESDDLLEGLTSLGIQYVPDFISNVGGLIALDDEVNGVTDFEPTRRRVAGLYSVVLRLLEEAERLGASAVTIASRRVDERLGRSLPG
jgi:glutamate dehydrogenase/leucine dehydrogenase